METQAIDFYEFMQISPHADNDTIHRVYRFLAARLHPDNAASGHAASFQLLKTAYDVLSDPQQRAEYDAGRTLPAQAPLSSSIDFMDALDGELNRRLAVLAVLYYRRRTNPGFPAVPLAEVEERMGFPRDYLDFTLWYLQKKGYIAKTDNAQYELSANGVDFVEEQRGSLPTLNKLLTSGSESTHEVAARPNRRGKNAAARETAEANGHADSTPGPIILPSSSARLGTRRTGNPDRRVGLPDLRTEKIERRMRLTAGER